MRQVNYVDEVRGDYEVSRAFGKAPHVPIAGTSTVSMSNETLQEDPISSDDVIAEHATIREIL